MLFDHFLWLNHGFPISTATYGNLLFDGKSDLSKHRIETGRPSTSKKRTAEMLLKLAGGLLRGMVYQFKNAQNM